MRVPPTSPPPVHRPARRAWTAWRAGLLWLACVPLGAAAASELDVQTRRQDDRVEVRAQATVQAPWALVWATLTDYEHLPEFVPGMHSSRVLSRKGATAVIEQRGEASFLMLRLPIDVTVESTERPPYLEVRRLRGNLRHLEGRYEVRTLANAALVQLSWVGSIAPETELPPLVGEALVRMSIRAQFAGMVEEIERREALRAQGMAPSARRAAPPATANNRQTDR